MFQFHFVLFLGDPKQFKPVGDKALYQKMYNTGNPKTQRQINEACGRSLWLQLTDVVFLTVPMRQTDVNYSQMLVRVASGECTIDDYNILMGRLISNPTVYNDEKFSTAQIVVHTNVLRREINEQLLLKQAKKLDQPLFRVIAKDSHPKYKLSRSTLKELNSLPDNKTHGLPGRCLLQVGGKVLLTTNVAVELGLTNGAEGVIEQIIFSDKENVMDRVSNDIVTLKYMPMCVLVRFTNAQCSLSGLPDKVIPVTPIEQTFKFGRRIDGKFISWTIHRSQLPLVPSNCITSYKGQGKDISPVIVDLCPPVGLSFDSSFAYVMLSRCKSLSDLAILRCFPFEVLKALPSLDLINDEERLERLASETYQRFLSSGH